MTLELDPANTKVEFTLPDVLHTVHGTFAMKSGLIHFNPSSGSASGFVLVDVKSGQSGNSTRDRKMHKDILQSEAIPGCYVHANEDVRTFLNAGQFGDSSRRDLSHSWQRSSNYAGHTAANQRKLR